MRREHYAARLQTAFERIESAGAGMGLKLPMPASRDPEMRILQFAEQLAGELEAYVPAELDEREIDVESALNTIRAASDADLDAVTGIGPATVAKLRDALGTAE